MVGVQFLGTRAKGMFESADLNALPVLAWGVARRPSQLS